MINKMFLPVVLLTAVVVGSSLSAADLLFILDGSTKEIKVFDGVTTSTVIPQPGGVDRNEIAIDTAVDKLYWSEVDKILRSDLDGTNVETVITGLDFASALDVDPTTGQIYWLDWGANGSFPSSTGSLSRVDYDGTNATTLVAGLGLPQGIRLDVIGGKIYFGDRNGGDPLRRCNLDGSNVEIIVPSAFAHHIALDLVNLQVYWSRGGAANIFRAGLDGSSPLPVTSGFAAAAGVAVDPVDGRIFWSDQIAQNVYMADLDGSSDAVLIPSLYAAGLVFVAEAPIDSDSDGLTDDDEILLGTDPFDSDTDDDLLLDGTEVDLADGTGCPNPLDPDSDNDTLPDGFEVALGTNPCNPDTDGDGVPDDVDPTPTDPGVTSGFIEDALRDLADDVDSLDLSLIAAKNSNAAAGRRNALLNKATAAANAVGNGDILDAIDQLLSLLQKLDGDPTPPDWMVDSPEKDAFQGEVQLLFDLLLFQ